MNNLAEHIRRNDDTEALSVSCSASNQLESRKESKMNALDLLKDLTWVIEHSYHEDFAYKKNKISSKIFEKIKNDAIRTINTGAFEDFLSEICDDYESLCVAIKNNFQQPQYDKFFHNIKVGIEIYCCDQIYSKNDPKQQLDPKFIPRKYEIILVVACFRKMALLHSETIDLSYESFSEEQ